MIKNTLFTILLCILYMPAMHAMDYFPQKFSRLVVAVEKGDLPTTLKLIRHNSAFIHKTDYNGTTLLYVASQNGHTDIVYALLNAGANPNPKPLKNDGSTTLFIASQNGHTEIVAALLTAGANPNLARTNKGATPLFIASDRGHTNIADALLTAGADPNLVTNYGESPLFKASSFGYKGIVAALLTTNGIDSNQARTTDGVTPLFAASFNGHAGIVAALLAANANPNQARTTDGATPLLAASLNGHIGAIVYLLAADDINPNQALTDNGGTPLHAASQNGHESITDMLLAANADPNQALTDNGATSLYLASLHGHANIVRLLIKAGADMPSIYFAQLSPDQQKLCCSWEIIKTEKYMNELIFAQRCELNSAKNRLYPDKEWKWKKPDPTEDKHLTEEEETEIVESIPNNTLFGIPPEILRKISLYAAGQEFQDCLHDASVAGPSA